MKSSGRPKESYRRNVSSPETVFLADAASFEQILESRQAGRQHRVEALLLARTVRAIAS